MCVCRCLLPLCRCSVDMSRNFSGSVWEAAAAQQRNGTSAPQPVFRVQVKWTETGSNTCSLEVINNLAHFLPAAQVHDGLVLLRNRCRTNLYCSIVFVFVFVLFCFVLFYSFATAIHSELWKLLKLWTCTNTQGAYFSFVKSVGLKASAKWLNANGDCRILTNFSIQAVKYHLLFRVAVLFFTFT